MASRITVDYTALDTAIGNFTTRHQNLETTLTTLESGLAPMLGSWEGSAQAMYVEKKAQWDAAAADLATLLASIKKLTDDAAKGYASTVAANLSTWQ